MKKMMSSTKATPNEHEPIKIPALRPGGGVPLLAVGEVVGFAVAILEFAVVEDVLLVCDFPDAVLLLSVLVLDEVALSVLATLVPTFMAPSHPSRWYAAL